MKLCLNKMVALLFAVLGILCAACKSDFTSSLPSFAHDYDVLRIFDQIPATVRIRHVASDETISFSGQTQYGYLFKILYTELHRQIAEENAIAQQRNVQEVYRLEVIGSTRQPIYTVSLSDTVIEFDGVQYLQGTLADTLFSCLAVAQVESLNITDPSGMTVQILADLKSDQLFYALVQALAKTGELVNGMGEEQVKRYYDLEILAADKTRKNIRVTPDAVLTENTAFQNTAIYLEVDKLFRERIVYPVV